MIMTVMMVIVILLLLLLLMMMMMMMMMMDTGSDIFCDCVTQLAEHRSLRHLAGELTLSALGLQPTGDHTDTVYVNRLLQVSQLSQLSLSSLRGQ